MPGVMRIFANISAPFKKRQSRQHSSPHSPNVSENLVLPPWQTIGFPAIYVTPVSHVVRITFKTANDIEAICVSGTGCCSCSRKAANPASAKEAELRVLRNTCLGQVPFKLCNIVWIDFHLREDVSIAPIKAKVCRPVPVHLRADADKVIDDLLQAEVIFPVTVPTEWTSFGHFVPKPNGGVRLVTDYVQLNKFVNRPVHPFPSSMDIIQSIDASSRYFIVMDCKFGYFQVPLDQESALLTTFLVPQGRFAYR